MSEAQFCSRWIAGSCLSGTFDFSDIEPLIGAHITSNTPHLMLFSTPQAKKEGTCDFLNAEIWVKAESGDVRIERMNDS